MSAKTDEYGFAFAEKTIKIGGKAWTFRELSVDENDECNDAGRGPEGTWNGRAAMRMMVLKSAVEPKLTMDKLSKMPLSVYNAIVEAVNDVNTREVEVEDGDPNA